MQVVLWGDKVDVVPFDEFYGFKDHVILVITCTYVKRFRGMTLS